MALSTAERRAIAQAFLRCYGEDYYYCGRTLRFLTDVGGFNLLANVQAEADTWAPFISAGMDFNSREWWKGELARIYNGTTTT